MASPIDDLTSARVAALRLRTHYVEELDFHEAMFWREAADRAKELLRLSGVVTRDDKESEQENA